MSCEYLEYECGNSFVFPRQHFDKFAVKPTLLPDIQYHMGLLICVWVWEWVCKCVCLWQQADNGWGTQSGKAWRGRQRKHAFISLKELTDFAGALLKEFKEYPYFENTIIRIVKTAFDTVLGVVCVSFCQRVHQVRINFRTRGQLWFFSAELQWFIGCFAGLQNLILIINT